MTEKETFIYNGSRLNTNNNFWDCSSDLKYFEVFRNIKYDSNFFSFLGSKVFFF